MVNCFGYNHLIAVLMLMIEFRLTVCYTQSPFIRTGTAFLEKFKNRSLGGSNLRTTSKNLRTASAQIFKAKNQFVDESIVDGPQKKSK